MSVKVSTILSARQYAALARKAGEFGMTIAEVSCAPGRNRRAARQIDEAPQESFLWGFIIPVRWRRPYG